MTLKTEAINAISTLPEDAKIEDMMYRLYVLQKMMEGQRAIINGHSKNIEELKKEVSNW